MSPVGSVLVSGTTAVLDGVFTCVSGLGVVATTGAGTVLVEGLGVVTGADTGALITYDPVLSVGCAPFSLLPLAKR